MRNIGFSGGSSIKELGTVADVVLFFRCLKFVVESKCPAHDWSLLTDRLYKRYIRQEEISIAKTQMDLAQKLFTEIPSSIIQQIIEKTDNDDIKESKLNINQPMLSDVFSRYFDAFAYCVESAQLNYDEFKSYPGYIYEPVKTVITDMPLYLEDTLRSPEEYDVLAASDIPFWLR